MTALQINLEENSVAVVLIPTEEGMRLAMYHAVDRQKIASDEELMVEAGLFQALGRGIIAIVEDDIDTVLEIGQDAILAQMGDQRANAPKH